MRKDTSPLHPSPPEESSPGIAVEANEEARRKSDEIFMREEPGDGKNTEASRKTTS